MKYNIIDRMNSFRLTVCDHYLATPLRGYDVTYSEFRGSDVKCVPVIRIFGPTLDGKKACAHVHGVFPYFYIPYEGTDHPDKLKYLIATGLDKAINVSLGQTNAVTQHVYKISLISGIPFYGYHEKEHKFFKVYLYNPNLVKRAADLLQNGSVMNTIFQPHESHVPFILQFMIDNNLQGMNIVNCANVIPRKSDDDLENMEEIPLKVSVCDVEVDILAVDILNRQSALSQNVVNPGIAALWQDEEQRRRLQGRISQPTPQNSQIREKRCCESEEFYRQRLFTRITDLTKDDSITSESQNSLNSSSSVPYPVELLAGENLLNASVVDLHTPMHSLNDTDNTLVENQTQTILMDTQDEELFDVLQELAHSHEDNTTDVDIETNIEQDSILQQPIDDNDDDIEYLEMTQPFDFDTFEIRKIKIEEENNDNLGEGTSRMNYFSPAMSSKNSTQFSGVEEIISQNSIENKTKENVTMEEVITSQDSFSSIKELLQEDGFDWTIPQLDGADDSSTSDDDKNINKNQSFIKKRRLGARGPVLKVTQEKDTAESSTSSDNLKQSILETCNSSEKIIDINKLIEEQNTRSLRSHTKSQSVSDDEKTSSERRKCLGARTLHVKKTGKTVKPNIEVKECKVVLHKLSQDLIDKYTQQQLILNIYDNEQDLSTDNGSQNIIEQNNSKDEVAANINEKEATDDQNILTDQDKQKSQNISTSEHESSKNEGSISDLITSDSEINLEDSRTENSTKLEKRKKLSLSFRNKSDKICDKNTVNKISESPNETEIILDSDSDSEKSIKNKTETKKNTPEKIKSFAKKTHIEKNKTPLKIDLSRSPKISKSPRGSPRKAKNLKNLKPLEIFVSKSNEKNACVTTPTKCELKTLAPTLFSPLKLDIKISSPQKTTQPQQLEKANFFFNSFDSDNVIKIKPEEIIDITENSDESIILFEDKEEEKLNISDSDSSIILCNDEDKSEKEDATLNIRRRLTYNSSINTIDPSDEEVEETSLSSAKTKILSSSNNNDSNETISSYNENMKSFYKYTPIANETNQSNLYVPLLDPPNVNEVLTTLSEYNLQEYSHPIPQYTTSADLHTKHKEVGNKVIKLTNRNELPNYQSIFTVFNNIEFNRNKSVIIEPLIEAPTRQQVINYIETTKKEVIVTKENKLRVQLPQSPSADNDYSDNESVSMSPCSDTTESRPWTPISPAVSQKLLHSTPMPKALLKCRTPLNRRVSTQSDSWCKLDGTSPLNNTFGFRAANDNLQDARAVVQVEQLTVLGLELHVSTRGNLKPDPDIDPIGAVFFLASCDDGLGVTELGVITVLKPGESNRNLLAGISKNVAVINVSSEKDIVLEVIRVVRHWDPDILLGYEIEMESWGYLIQRAAHLEVNMVNLLSRVPKYDKKSMDTEQIKQQPASQGTIAEYSDLKIPGRIILNLWRLMRHEVALQSYVFENVAFHVLHERVPKYSFRTLTYWWEHPSLLYRWIVIDYWLERICGSSKLIDQLDLIGRTSELAKLFGIQFYEVFSRGSQFRVESMMLRLAKPRNYVAVSPSTYQRAHMRAPEYIPLILEPESKYYSDPIIVLDFQSLYPSMIIAYNYCFSTTLGRVDLLGQDAPFQFGCSQLKVPRKILRKYTSSCNISPCGVAFVTKDVREGILPRMLKEILDTRLMVKKSMKENKENVALQRILHARQLGLKLIANVTYGYTAAHFSGRMPCVEVGDSVVSKGKETLNRAIEMVQNNPKWGAKVVYGDTDSLFVMTPGKNRKQAFDIGAQIAAAVTADNPSPVKLKLEKVYQPCILQTKKRYVGYMYESPDQESPIFEAKGIETVRRDGCPAVSKMLEKSLRLLFETQDVSRAKLYVVKQFQKLLMGRVNVQDLVFAKEFRGFSGYKPGACVPALELARQWIKVDRRSEPRQGERVPYVIINGAPGLPLIRLVRSPHDLLQDPSLRINAEYYITRAISPALDRCFSLLGADVFQWFKDMPRRTIKNLPKNVITTKNRSTISQYFATVECAVCREQTRDGLCITCQSNPRDSVLSLMNKISRLERAAHNIDKICISCCGHENGIDCNSLVCPILFRRIQSHRDVEQVSFMRDLISKYF